MVRDFGGDTVAGDPPSAHLTDSQTVAAYQYLWDLMYKHQVMPTPQDSSDLGGDATHLFVAGKLAMTYDLDDAANSVAQAVGGQFKLSVAPTPKGPGKRVQNAGGSAFAIPKGSGQSDVAYELMRWIVGNPDLLPKIASDPSGGTFVSNAQFWKSVLPAPSAGIPDDAFAHTFHDLGLRDGVPPAHFNGYVQWDADIYAKNTSALWTGQERDVGKAMATMQAQTIQLLQSLQAK